LITEPSTSFKRFKRAVHRFKRKSITCFNVQKKGKEIPNLSVLLNVLGNGEPNKIYVKTNLVNFAVKTDLNFNDKKTIKSDGFDALKKLLF